MANPLYGVAPLFRGGGSAKGRIARLEEVVDKLVRFCANMHAGVGVDITFENEGDPQISATGGGGAAGALDNSAFIAEATADGNRFSVKILGGTAQGIFGGITVFDTETYTNISNGTIFWLEYAPYGVAWTMEHGASLPQSASNPDPDNPNYFAVIPICRVDSEAPNNIVQYHYGSVYVPVATNVVDVQTVASESEGEGEGESE